MHQPATMTSAGSERSGSSLEVARVFLRLGLIGFGGPAAHIALMEDELVRRRGWLTRERFLDLLGASHLIPGPNSTELAIHLGRERAGWPGFFLGGACFIAPAFLIVLGLAAGYVRFGALPAVVGLLWGVKPVIIALVLQALWGLARAATRTWPIALTGLSAIALCAAGFPELLVLFAAGTALALLAWRAARTPQPLGVSLALLATVPATSATAAPFGLLPLFLFFLKVGSVLFGSGYVLLALLRGDLVERWHWLSEAQLLDAIAVGQITPGPLLTAATFIGYILAGVPGAGLATLGIFLPAFFFVAVSGPLIPKLRRSKVASGFLDGVNVASIGLLALVTVELARSAIVDLATTLLALTSSVLLVRYRVNPAWLMVAAAVIGIALHR